MQIASILVSIIAPFDNHIANGGDKLLGNASSIKKRGDGKVYVSGQMQRHVFFSAVNKLNLMDESKRNTYVSNSDGITDDIAKDLRADLGGYMHTEKEQGSKRRTGAVSVTPAVAMNESKVSMDLLTRVKSNPDGQEQAIATKEFSEHDDMVMNFFLDLSTLGIVENPKYENNFNVSIDIEDMLKDDNERKRRAKLFLESTFMLNDYANKSRNMVCGEPKKILIVFNPKFSRKASRYFIVSEIEQKNILDELKNKGAQYYIGDDECSDKAVYKACEEAMNFLGNKENTLYNPAKIEKETVEK